MLSIHKIESAANAKHYFEKDNYYTKDGALQNSYWYGKSCKELELGEHVHSDDFFKLLDGHFQTDTLGRVADGKRHHTPGWDCTFSAPKSVSILAEVTGNQAVKDAHTSAVQKALDYIESVAAVSRVTIDKQSKPVITGELCFAAFTHDTSRELDPQLHTHCVVMNGTKTVNGWRSLSSLELYRMKIVAGQYYRNELACRLKNQGYAIRPAGKHGLFEIAGMSDDTLKHFSVRRQQIENYLAEHNLAPTPTNSELATLKTRKNKTAVDRLALRALWQDRFASLGINHDLLINDLPITPQNSKTVVRRAIRLLSEQQMSFTEAELLSSCFTADIGNASSKAVEAEIERLKSIKLLLPGDNNNLTTQRGKRLEKQILANLHSTKNQFLPIIKKSLRNHVLNADQLNAVNTCLLSHDQFIGLQGSAGTGKTTALAVLHNSLIKRGYDVTAIAPTHTVVSAVASSIECNASTVDSFLMRKFEKSSSPQFWLVDESSFLSAKKIERIQKLAIRQNARVLFIGDHAQLESIEAGRAFWQLQNAGMDTAIMSKIMRQKDEQLFDAVTHVVNDEFSHAIDKIESSVHEIDSDHDRIKTMVRRWLDYDKADRDDVLMLAPSTIERSAANQLTHNALLERGEIGHQSLSFSALSNRQISNVESRTVSSYLIGDILRFARDYKASTKKLDNSINKNDYYDVVGINRDQNQLILQSRLSNQRFALNPSKRGGNRIGGIAVFSEETTAFNIGEKIRWTDNNNSIGLKRNSCLTIDAINNGKLIATDQSNNKTVTIDPEDMHQRHLIYNYANTIYAAQGKTCNHVLALANSKQLNLVNRKSFYVTISRARQSASIFTNDKSKLKTAIGERFGQNTTALKAGLVTELRQQSQLEPANYLI
ncbi:MAG: relaxase domain-containing protein [Gammaproteobacteria bacterium]|nr:relaxase domain-containing protein [Gammaproteobacteria bacterium]